MYTSPQQGACCWLPFENCHQRRIATAGYLLLAFLNWFARYDVLSGMEVATAMARKDTTLGSRRCQSAHFPLMLCISCGLQHPSPHLCTVKSIVRLMIAKAHMRGLWEAGVCSCFFTLYVSLSFHADRFHTSGISMRSMCTGACHACTASHCDLWDPGWGDPGSLHCDFFAWQMMLRNCSICLMPIFGVGKIYRIWTLKGGPPQYVMYICVYLTYRYLCMYS